MESSSPGLASPAPLLDRAGARLAPLAKRIARRPHVLLALAMALAAALIFWESRGQALYADELAFLTRYRGLDFDVLIQPQSGNLVVFTVLVYKAVFATLGAASYLPFRLFAVAFSLLCAGLFFGLARRRVGDLAALFPTVLLLFLGSSAEVLATPFGFLALLPTAAGLGTLLALERDDPRSDVLAFLLLSIALAAYSIGVAFAVAAAAQILLLRDRRQWRSLWVVVAPMVLYTAWRLWALQFDDSNFALANLTDLPSSMLTSLAATCASITGLFRTPGQGFVELNLDWGFPVGAVLVAVVVLRLRRPPPVDRRFWVYAAALVSFWALVSLNLGPFRAPEASRYQHLSAIFLLLAVVELVADLRPPRLEAAAVKLLPGLRIPRWPLALLGVALALSLLANVVNLHQGAAEFRRQGELLRADLAAVELAAGRADPQAPVVEVPDVPVFRDVRIPVREYLAAVDDYGSPAYTVGELAAAPEDARLAADANLVRLLRVRPRAEQGAPEQAAGRPLRPKSVAGGDPVRRGACVGVLPSPGSEATVALRLQPGGLSVRAAPGPPVTVALRRFASGFGSPLRGIAGGSTARVEIPGDAAPQPWQALVRSRQEIELCPNPA